MKNSAQSVTEYAIVLGIVIVALMAMQIYMQRGIQGVIKSVADDVGNQKEAEEVDPIKGAVSINSRITRVTSGAPEDTAELPKGKTMRVRTYSGGERKSDFYTTVTASGNSTTVSQQPE